MRTYLTYFLSHRYSTHQWISKWIWRNQWRIDWMHIYIYIKQSNNNNNHDAVINIYLIVMFRIPQNGKVDKSWNTQNPWFWSPSIRPCLLGQRHNVFFKYLTCTWQQYPNDRVNRVNPHGFDQQHAEECHGNPASENDTPTWQENNTGNKLWLELGADFLVCFSYDNKQSWCWFSSNYAPQHECCLSLLSHQYTPGWPCRWLGPLARSATASGPMAIFEDHRAYCHCTSLLLILNSVYCSWFLFCVYCYSYYCYYETLLLLLL